MIKAQYINLNMIPSGVMPVLYCSQYDVGRPLGMVLYNGGESVDLDSYTCTIEATRTDGTPITAAVTTDGNIGAFETTANMTNKADCYQAKMVIADSSGNRVASLAFVMMVTPKTMDENAESIEEDKSLYQQYTGTVQTLIADIRENITDLKNQYNNQQKHTSWYVMPEDYGAVGDGVTDDTQAMQKALDAGSVRLGYNKTYLVKKHISAPVAAALKIPSNRIIDLNGSTIKLDNAQNCCVFVNDQISTIDSAYHLNENITIKNGIIDGNCDDQAQSGIVNAVPTFCLWGVDDLIINNLQINNGYCAGFYLRNAHNAFIDNLSVRYAIGCGISILNAYDSAIGCVSSYDIDKFPSTLSGFYGNGFVATLHNCTVESIISKNIYWGVKIQDTSNDVVINYVQVYGGEYTDYDTVNGSVSGVKVQGYSASAICKNIKINNITVEAFSSGLYVYAASDVEIGSYTGIKNGKTNQTVSDNKVKSDIYMTRVSNVRFKDVYICDGYFAPIWVQANNNNIYFGVIVLEHTGAVTPIYSTNLISVINALRVFIETIKIIEGGTWTESTIVFFSGTSSLIVNEIEGNITPTNARPILNKYSEGVGDFEVKSVHFNGDATSGIISFVWHKAVTVENKNIWQGERMFPVIALIPYNSATLSGAVIPHRIIPKTYSSGYGFTINYGDFDESLSPQYIWKLLGYKSLN